MHLNIGFGPFGMQWLYTWSHCLCFISGVDFLDFNPHKATYLGMFHMTNQQWINKNG